MSTRSGPVVQRWAAFTNDPAGGNPAGLVLGADDLDEADMQQIAADISYAETAFVTGAGRQRGIRSFSPVAEVPFCGHATVAAAIALAGTEGDGTFAFATPVGEVEIATRMEAEVRTASFTSVEPHVEPLEDRALDAVLSLIGAQRDDMDAAHPPALAYAGNRHPLVVLTDDVLFDTFTFDPDVARELLDAEGWPATIIVLRDLGDGRWDARNIFPVGTLTEDPATGAAAAATGAYLRATGAVAPPAHVVITQGRHVGRPGLLTVDIPAEGGITVSGTAVPIA
jgi:PhzF family phenazine biosynthesis protein